MSLVFAVQTLEFKVQLNNISCVRVPLTTNGPAFVQPICNIVGLPLSALFGFEDVRRTEVGHGITDIIVLEENLLLLWFIVVPVLATHCLSDV